MHRFLLAVFLLVPCLGACASPYTPSPDRPFEAIPEFTSSASVALVNAQDDGDWRRIGRGLKASYHDWTDVAIQIVQRELTKRGVRVDPASERSLRLAITGAKAWTGWVKLGANIDMRVETGDGYSAAYEGLNNAVMAGIPRRQVDGAMMRVIVEMLKDPRIVAYLEGVPASAAPAAP